MRVKEKLTFKELNLRPIVRTVRTVPTFSCRLNSSNFGPKSIETRDRFGLTSRLPLHSNCHCMRFEFEHFRATGLVLVKVPMHACNSPPTVQVRQTNLCLQLSLIIAAAGKQTEKESAQNKANKQIRDQMLAGIRTTVPTMS